MPSTIWCTLTFLISIAISQSPPSTTTTLTEPGCSANYAYVYVESSLHTLSKTITSDRVNYPPYTYTNTIPRRKLVPFALNEPISDTSNNPCDISTWTIPPTAYDNSIILLQYSPHFATVCTPQAWTLNFQTYNTNIQALLIANDADLFNVYPLPGDNTLPAPTIPTRMISQTAAHNILNILNTTTEDIFVSIDCFNTTSPSIICMVDESVIGNNVDLDGEFQKQADIFMNDHPVWMKEGMNTIWEDYYIWLTIDTDAAHTHQQWKWVIGTDYTDESSIRAACHAMWSNSMSDPTQCSGNWYNGAVLITELISHNGVCDLGDTYVCVNSGSPFFDYYFSGRYRQVHSGTTVWIGDNTRFDALMGMKYVNMSFASGYSFVFSYAANGGVYAFCPVSQTLPSKEIRLSPWDCNDNWYVVVKNEQTGAYQWYNDPLMDVDLCNHPDVSTSAPKAITYPKYMCFMDAVTKYSPYQTYYGIYELDNSTANMFDNRHVYQNKRLSGLQQGEWYIMWYDEKDSWIINERIPTLTYTTTFGGICRDNVNTPDQCSQCWEFYHGIHSILNCDAKVQPVLTNNEADCMPEPVNNIVTYQDDVTLCFQEGHLDPLTHAYTGKWKLERRYTHGGRRYWVQEAGNGDILNYLYYDDIWRYWIIHSRFTDEEQEWHLRCFLWDEFEPFNCKEWFTRDSTILLMNRYCSLAPTQSPTPHPTTECIEYNKYVFAESPGFTNQIMESSEVNFPPYKSDTFYRVELVLFEEMTHTTGSPCDSSTWAELPSYYDNTVVFLKWNGFFTSLCTVQQFTLQLEAYANVIAVLIANDADLTHVYALAGDETLVAPSIPTRMISQMAGYLLYYSVKALDPVWITFGCFDNTQDYPNTICLVDTTMVGEHVYLDGEYQRQNFELNNHPVWSKQGHIGLWGNIYMFLDVDKNVAGVSSWKWVIGTDYTDRNSIIAECDLNGQHIDHPALCDLDWSINGSLVSNISTKGNQCSLGDNYICVESTSGGFFEHYFEGRYRQVHSGVPLWLLESDSLDAHIRIAEITWPSTFGDAPQYVFSFMVNQSDIYAFCVIGTEKPTWETALAPFECNTDWYVIDYDHSDAAYKWIIDLAFDIDECTHANLTTTAQPINYPQYLCLSDYTNGYSHYQGHWGVYMLDTTQQFDGRYVYKNRRLDGVKGNEWYFLWFDEKDSWVLNEYIPGETVVRDTDGICRDDVATPDLCNSCWEFYKGHEMQRMCHAKVDIAATHVETDCLGPMPVNNIIHYTKEINLCFDDGVTSDWDHQYSGKWYLEDKDTFGGRAYWYKIDTDLSLPGQEPMKSHFMFYDAYWRFWVIDNSLGRSDDNGWDYLHYYCLLWDEFEPFNCLTWYSAMSYKLPTMNMRKNCQSSAPTVAPTKAPTINCDARNSWIYAETDNYIYSTETLISMYTNFPPLMYDTFDRKKLVIFENGRVMDEHNSNPCNFDTWQEMPFYYENKVVMVKHDAYIATLCSPELWTWNLETYANNKIIAVLIAQNEDLNHVYPLSGNDETYKDSNTPTRMVSQFVGIGVEEAIDMGENVYITFGCFDDVDGIDYPNIICLVDTSIIGKYVYLDGEYQRQYNVVKNEHPVWMKRGFEGIWKEIYMWLDIDSNINGVSSWKWVIGNDYTTRHSIIAECILAGTPHIDHPALCDGNWYINGKFENNITTSDTICDLGDNYVCVDSAIGGLFDSYFDGHYRQIHSSVPLWFLEDSYGLDAYLTIGTINWPPLFENEFSFAFVLNQSQIFAFCPIGKDYPTQEIALKPEDCNKNWYKLEILDTGYTWVEDFVFDIDECAHKDLVTPTPYVEYPEILCMNDANDEYSRYQSHYGIYLLDYKQTYGGKYVYYNQRLAKVNDVNNNYNEWYMLWYEAKDAWVISEIVPQRDSWNVRDKEGICRDESDSPDMCSKCWEFSDSLGKYEMNCNVYVTVMDNNDESNCVILPGNDVIPNEYISTIILGFDDGVTDMDKNVYSGIWILSQHAAYNNRAYWYKYYNALPGHENNHVEIEYYMFYDSTYRYWIVDKILGNTNEIKLYCLQWREFQPFNCDVWYTNTVGLTMKMDNTYELASTTTKSPQDTSRPTPVTNINTDTTKVVGAKDSDKKAFNIMPWIAITIGFVTLCGGSILLFCYCKKKRKKRFMFKDVSKDGIFKTVYGVSANAEDEDINLNVVQMENVNRKSRGFRTKRVTKTRGTKSKGEIIAMESDDDDVISHQIIDENEGTGTITGFSANNDDDEMLYNKPKKWVKFEQ